MQCWFKKKKVPENAETNSVRNCAKNKKHNRFKCHISHYFLISYIVTQPNNYEISFTRTIGDL